MLKCAKNIPKITSVFKKDNEPVFELNGEGNWIAFCTTFSLNAFDRLRKCAC